MILSLLKNAAVPLKGKLFACYVIHESLLQLLLFHLCDDPNTTNPVAHAHTPKAEDLASSSSHIIT